MARPFGSKNAKTEQWEMFSDWFLTGGLERLQAEMAKLKGEEFVRTMKDLLEYFQPKLARTELLGANGKPLLFVPDDGKTNS